MRKLKLILPLMSMLGLLGSCTSLKPYERIYISDPEMQMESSVPKNVENYVHSIREGATPSGSTTKSSGGCGCN